MPRLSVLIQGFKPLVFSSIVGSLCLQQFEDEEDTIRIASVLPT